MDSIKLFDGELKLMELLWVNEPVSAKQLSMLAEDRIGWNKNTTYTVIKKLMNKKVILRTEPNFICSSLIKKEDVVKAETDSLIEKLCNGSRKAFFAAFLQDENLSKEDIAELKAMIEKW
ncbi:MAG TPA: BlaI/MecI/CopY family transcriptional regulator [Anaerovoracaceae bacterium]|nr:BlaI/MecI/CopY family transcriptional regulator [Anaerovoracaceae bacterium]